MRQPLVILTILLTLATAAHAADDPVAAAQSAATQKFDQSPAGKALTDKQRAAETRLAQARQSGTLEERSQAAQAALDARQAYRAALQKVLDVDPGIQKAKADAIAAKSKLADPSPDADPAPMNAAVLAFVRENVGKQVGNGECYTLADKALNVAGAKAPDAYVWGRPLDPAKDAILPGDIIQFTSVHFGEGGFVIGTPHHTSIIDKVVAPGVYHVLHQNVGGKTVTDMTINVNARTSGDLVIYRPLPGGGYKG